MTSELNTVAINEECQFDTRTQVRLQLSRSAHRTLAHAKVILQTRGMESVSTEDLVRACLEEHLPIDLASLFLEHRLKQKGTSICDY
ncbi:hypothetical protein FIP36_17230 [Salmonella enterica]|nr:hypothetical protein [Salmonella enterica]